MCETESVSNSGSNGSKTARLTLSGSLTCLFWNNDKASIGDIPSKIAVSSWRGVWVSEEEDPAAIEPW